MKADEGLIPQSKQEPIEFLRSVKVATIWNVQALFGWVTTTNEFLDAVLQNNDPS